MNCTTYQEEINHFIGGEMGMDRQVDLFQHLAGCADCQSFIDAMIRMKEATRNEQIAYPGGLDDAVLGQLLSRTPSPLQTQGPIKRGVNIWKRRIALPVPLAASLAVIIIGLGLLLGRPFVPPTQPRQLSTPLQTNSAQPHTVILIYGIPPVEVIGTPPVRSSKNFQHRNN